MGIDTILSGIPNDRHLIDDGGGIANNAILYLFGV
jgi:hypothetical protein